MNSPIVGIRLNGITVSTEEYTIGHFSPNVNQYGIQDNIWGKNTYFEYDLKHKGRFYVLTKELPSDINEHTEPSPVFFWTS